MKLTEAEEEILRALVDGADRLFDTLSDAFLELERNGLASIHEDRWGENHIYITEAGRALLSAEGEPP